MGANKSAHRGTTRPRPEQAKLIAIIEQIMVNVRGFPRFAAFDQLSSWHWARKPNQTLSELYPQIIAWFERDNAAGAAKK